MAQTFDEMAEKLEIRQAERDEANRKLTQSLEEKTLLLRELYHRTKNNMQIIMSIINLQADNFSEELVSDAFQDVKNRILAMAIAHEQLYESKNLCRIGIPSYIRELTQTLAMEFRGFADRISR